MQINIILLLTNIAALLLAAAFFASPKGSEWLGRVLLAHAEALRVYQGLIRLARSEYKRAYQGRLAELHASATEVNA